MEKEEKKVLLLDYDWTIAPFNQYAGTKVIKDSLSTDFGLKSEEVGDEFAEMYEIMDAIHHNRADYRSGEFLRSINAYNIIPTGVMGNYDIDFGWSRELWLKNLSDKYELKLEGDKIMKIIDDYWGALTEASPVFPAVPNYLTKLKDVGVFVITGSDRRLTFVGDEIRYYPDYSAEKKVARLRAAGLSKWIDEKHIITGDPYDKPCDEFWAQVTKKAGISKDTTAIVVDDSLNTVKSAKKMGFKAYLMDRRALYGKNQVANDADGYLTEIDQLVIN